VARGLNNLANLLEVTSRYSDAEPLLRQALAIDEKSFGPDHPKVGTCLNNLGLLLFNFLRRTGTLRLSHYCGGRWQSVKETLVRIIPRWGTCLNSLALLLLTTNRHAEAEPLLRRALAIDENSFGLDHPKVATGLGVLAELLLATGLRSEAEPLFRRALAIDEKSFGPDHLAEGPNRHAGNDLVDSLGLAGVSGDSYSLVEMQSGASANNLAFIEYDFAIIDADHGPELVVEELVPAMFDIFRESGLVADRQRNCLALEHAELSWLVQWQLLLDAVLSDEKSSLPDGGFPIVRRF
jgi:tetratricopeptide (TPR) repeat protein